MSKQTTNSNLFASRTKKKAEEKIKATTKSSDGLTFADFMKRKEIFGNLKNGNDDFKLEIADQNELHMIAYYSIDYGQPLPDNYMTSTVEWKRTFHIDHVQNFVNMYKHVYENNRVYRNVNTIEKLMSILKNFDIETYKERCKRLYETAIQGKDYDLANRIIEKQANDMMYLKMGRRKVLYTDILYIPEYDQKGNRIFELKNIENIIE